jgi:predicted nucleotidyltransferase
MKPDQRTIQDAIDVLLDHAPDGSKVILFGSYARNAEKPTSDIDFLVVEPDVCDRIREAARLRIAVHRVLKKFMVPVDILVLSKAEFERWSQTPSTVYYHAAEEGQVHERVA